MAVVYQYPYTDSFMILVIKEMTKKCIQFMNICIYLLWSLFVETEYILTACAVVCIGCNWGNLRETFLQKSQTQIKFLGATFHASLIDTSASNVKYVNNRSKKTCNPFEHRSTCIAMWVCCPLFCTWSISTTAKNVISFNTDTFLQ